MHFSSPSGVTNAETGTKSAAVQGHSISPGLEGCSHCFTKDLTMETALTCNILPGYKALIFSSNFKILSNLAGHFHSDGTTSVTIFILNLNFQYKPCN